MIAGTIWLARFKIGQGQLMTQVQEARCTHEDQAGLVHKLLPALILHHRAYLLALLLQLPLSTPAYQPALPLSAPN